MASGGSSRRACRRLCLALAALAVAGSAALATGAVPAHASTQRAATPGTGGAGSGGSGSDGSDWPSAGQNNDNTHDNAAATAIGTSNAGTLKPKWVFTAAGDISATATVAGGAVYVPDWGGELWAIDASSGKAEWSRTIASYDGIPGDVSRTSPAYANGDLFIGTGGNTLGTTQGAYVVGINAKTGAMAWRTEVDANPEAIVTSSPTVDDGVVYVGTSSKAEGSSATPTFRGAVLALSAATGKVLWRTYTVPAGYTGGAVWGSQPTVDHQTGLLYVGDGNNYTSPAGVCVSPGQAGCTPRDPADHIDSVLALNLKTGAVQWSKDTLSADTWTIPMPNDSPDYDFGTDPQLYTANIGGQATQLLGIGQKSGVYWALDPATGKVVWQTQAGPGGSFGGILWGTATDGQHIFVDQANRGHVPTTITAADGTKSTVTSGFFEALDAATGKVDWQVADPQGGDTLDDSFVSIANDVAYFGSAAPSGNNMYALEGNTGKLLWSYASGGSVFAGAAIAGDTVYWGSGYHTEDFGLGYSGDNDKLYAFSPTGPCATASR